MEKYPYVVGDCIRLKVQWSSNCLLPVGATARITHVCDYDTFRCCWDKPHDNVFGGNALFGGAEKWFELADGPW